MEVSPTRLAVYKLLIYGGEDGRPLIAASVAKALGRTEPTISRHIAALKRAGYIRPIKGMESAILYVKGPLGDILDERLKGDANPTYGLAQGRGPNAHYCDEQDKKPRNPLPVPTGEVHLKGRVIFPVLRQGDLFHPIPVQDGRGTRSVKIFERTPVHWGGVTYYQGLVPIDGTTVKVQFWDTDKPALHVWPLPELIVRSTVREADPRLTEAARRVTNFLSKHGGWRFGEPELIGDIHYATNDPLIVQHITPGYQPPADSGYRVDGTPGPVALECDDPDSAEAMLGYLTATRELRADQKGLGQRQRQLEGQIAQVRTENLEMILELHQDNNHILRSTRERHRIEELERDSRHDDDGTVMYS